MPACRGALGRLPVRPPVRRLAISQAHMSRHSTDDPRPQPPARPADDECCHGGCVPCVFDRYDDALERYRAALAAWEAREAARRRERA